MDTNQLQQLLSAAYPNMTFEQLAYTHQGAERVALLLQKNGMAIHDPTVSECGRFGAEPYFYGMTENHARMLRRHNLHYERTQVQCFEDLQAIKASVLRAVASDPDRLHQDPKEFLLDLGFEEYNSGGVMVYRIDDPSTGQQLLVFDNEGDGIPATFADIEMARYGADESLLGPAIDIHGEPVYPDL